MKDSKTKLHSELENRKHNLAVIQETIEADARSGQKLLSVRDFLYKRIETLEQELRVKSN